MSNRLYPKRIFNTIHYNDLLCQMLSLVPRYVFQNRRSMHGKLLQMSRKIMRLCSFVSVKKLRRAGESVLPGILASSAPWWLVARAKEIARHFRLVGLWTTASINLLATGISASQQKRQISTTAASCHTFSV